MNGELIQDLGWVRLLQGDWDGASQYARKALEIDPDGDAWWLLVNALAMKGDHDAALKAIETGRQRAPLAPWNVMTAIAYARVGNRPEALRWLDRVGPDAPGPVLLSVAAVHGMLGDADRAFAILDSLVQDDPYMLVLLSYDPDFDPIRDDPRFEEVRRRAREEVMQRNRTY
jgi:tetratricopeptide (TPR) repeat protein